MIFLVKLTVKKTPEIDDEINFRFFIVINLLKIDVKMTSVFNGKFNSKILTKYQRENSVNYLTSKSGQIIAVFLTSKKGD